MHLRMNSEYQNGILVLKFCLEGLGLKPHYTTQRLWWSTPATHSSAVVDSCQDAVGVVFSI